MLDCIEIAAWEDWEGDLAKLPLPGLLFGENGELG
jgi:hypothetical protein